jgi:hypothetical protein
MFPTVKCEIPCEIETGIFWREPGNLGEQTGNLIHAQLQGGGRRGAYRERRLTVQDHPYARTDRDGRRTGGKSACARFHTRSAIAGRPKRTQWRKGQCGNPKRIRKQNPKPGQCREILPKCREDAKHRQLKTLDFSCMGTSLFREGGYRSEPGRESRRPQFDRFSNPNRSEH